MCYCGLLWYFVFLPLQNCLDRAHSENAGFLYHYSLFSGVFSTSCPIITIKHYLFICLFVYNRETILSLVPVPYPEYILLNLCPDFQGCHYHLPTSAPNFLPPKGIFLLSPEKVILSCNTAAALPRLSQVNWVLF